jgi:hypothetical protein
VLNLSIYDDEARMLHEGADGQSVPTWVILIFIAIIAVNVLIKVSEYVYEKYRERKYRKK